MPKASGKTKIKFSVNIKPGPVTPLQKNAWRRFWQKLMSGVKADG